MNQSASRRVLMISTHGYVSAAPEFGKPDTGGQVVYVLELSRCLARMGFQVDVLTRRFEDQPKMEEAGPGVTIRRFACGGPDFIPKEHLDEHIPEWVENASEFVEAVAPDCAFIDSHYWDAGLAGQLLADRFELAHLHTPHSLGVWKRDNMDGAPEQLERTYNFRRRIATERGVYHRAGMLIATTPHQHEILRKEEYGVPESRIRVIPPGYDDTRFFPVSDASRQAIKQQLDAEGPVVLALGRVARNKGYDLLLRSMQVVIQRVPEARLLLAIGSTTPNESEQKQVDQLRQLAIDLGVYEQVMFRDYIPDELLADHYRAADVFALSSRYEPFGMTAVEAMACGTPTVITTEGGLWEQVTWGLEALYANPFDDRAYGHMIATVLQYPRIARQLAEHGSLKARSCFTWTGIAQQLLAVLDNLARVPPSPVFAGDEEEEAETEPVGAEAVAAAEAWVEAEP